MLLSCVAALPNKKIVVDHWVFTMAKWENRQRPANERFCVDASLVLASQDQAAYLAKNGKYEHVQTPGKPGFTGVSLLDRAKVYGFHGGVTENLMRGCGNNLACVVSAWVKSPGHLKNIRTPGYTRFGAARAVNPSDPSKPIWVMMTGKRNNNAPCNPVV